MYKFGYFHLRRYSLAAKLWTRSHSVLWKVFMWAVLSTAVLNLPSIVGWPLTFFHFCGSVLGKHATDGHCTVLTRLRQNGRPCAMMLMLKILRTFWGGNCSLATSLGSARSSGWSPGGTCGVSFPQTAVGIFLRAPEEEKRGIGQCRSIAEQPFYSIISRNPRWMSGACCREHLSFLSFADVSILSSLNLLTQLLASCPPAEYHPLKYLRSVTSALRHGQAEQLLSGPEMRIVQINQSVLPQTGAAESASMTPLSGMRSSSRPT